MSNNIGHNSSSCSFAEQIISYLYDEASAREKQEFETHLKICAACAEELSGFGFVRSSISEWRREEIFALEMPALEIPILRTANLANKPEISVEPVSWLDNLKHAFSLSPKFAFGTAALAALAVCVGLVLVIINFSGNESLAEKENQKPEQMLASNTNQAEQTPAPKDDKIFANETEPQKIVRPENRPLDKQPTVKKDSVAKNSGSAPKNKSNAHKPNNTFAVSEKNKKNLKAPTEEIPTLTDFDEDEDKSLRLADLFDEIDTE